MSEVLLTRREGAVLVLSNNNPAARNALSPEFYAALTQALAQAEADPAVGAIVLTGEGGHFCSGGDLRQLVSGLVQAQHREATHGQGGKRSEGESKCKFFCDAEIAEELHL